jgi:pimeloyl-ACP methyl ester carboxylesterase
MMLQDDSLDGYVGSFKYNGEDVPYHMDGAGTPVLMTMGLSAIGGSYDWRYIYDCLSGAFHVYALDVLGLKREGHRQVHGPCYYEGLIGAFLERVIGERSSIISGPIEASYALKASFEHPRLIDKVVMVSPDGIRRMATHDTIGRSVLYRILRIPKVESVMYGSFASKRSMLIFLSNLRHRSHPGDQSRALFPSRMRPKYPPLPVLSERLYLQPATSTSLMQAPMKLSRMIRKARRMVGEMEDFRILRNARLIVFQRSGELPMRKEALRFCDDAIKFLS